MEIRAHVTDVDWDSDGESLELPRSMVVSVEVDAVYEIEDAVSDAISQRTGFCHRGFDYHLISA